MFKPIMIALAACLLIACGGSPDTSQGDGVVRLSGSASGVIVNGESIPQPLLEAYARKRGWNLTDPGQMAQVKEKTAELVAMAQAAQSAGLYDDAQLRADMALEQLNFIAGQLLEREQQANEPSDAELRAEYDREKAKIGEHEYRIGHILFDQQAQAEQVLAESKADDFDALMARYQDQAGIREAREIGWVKRNQLPEVLREPLQGLTAGSVAGQVYQSEFGWHLLKLYEIREFEGPSFAQLKDAIRQSLQRKVAADYARQVREAAKIDGLSASE